MSKATKQFAFVLPVVQTTTQTVEGSKRGKVTLPVNILNSGEMLIMGIAYDSTTFDINEIIYRTKKEVLAGYHGTDVLSLLTIIGDGNIHNVPLIELATAEHVAAKYEESILKDILYDTENIHAA